ncbi:hypothetical protein [Calothrix sp. PCC 7507]|uniref:hypothetical protein n=1 Tax=Calothrix sp. PCC 7507 TaxID=99598 RepID=UPI0005AA490C|nr:hypothetical protein [Calothrix sp. PCC 7507]
MNIIICPGIHEPELTKSFLSGSLDQFPANLIDQKPVNILIYPGSGVLTLSGFHILQFLCDRLGDQLKSPVIFISYSAGVVGAIVAASLWQLSGGNIKAFIAIDGWGVPLFGDFPIHRMSHNYFTHWSSSLLGSGQDNFYAEPAVDHLSMWSSPQMIQGCWVNQAMAASSPASNLGASEFLHLLLKRYEEK